MLYLLAVVDLLRTFAKSKDWPATYLGLKPAEKAFLMLVLHAIAACIWYLLLTVIS